MRQPLLPGWYMHDDVVAPYGHNAVITGACRPAGLLRVRIWEFGEKGGVTCTSPYFKPGELKLIPRRRVCGTAKVFTSRPHQKRT